MLRKHFDMNSFLAGRQHERELLKREMHDGLTPELIGIKSLTIKIASLHEDKYIQELIGELQKQVDRTMSIVEGFVNGSAPKHIKNLFLEDAVSELIKDCSSYRLEVKGKSNIQIKHKEIGMELYRVIQEFITNALKHSDGDKISIQFQASKAETKIAMQENGYGFDLNKTQLGNGLNNMAYRLNSIHADYLYSSSPGHGTSLKIKIKHENDEHSGC